MIYKGIIFKADPFSYNLEFDDRITLVGGDSGTGKTFLYGLLKDIYNMGKAIGQATNRKLMRDLRIYMAVGGMPQAVEAYLEHNNPKGDKLIRLK